MFIQSTICFVWLLFYVFLLAYMKVQLLLKSLVSYPMENNNSFMGKRRSEINYQRA